MSTSGCYLRLCHCDRRLRTEADKPAFSYRTICRLTASKGKLPAEYRVLKRLLATAAIVCCTLALPISAAEPVAGVWRLAQQEINGQRTDFEPLTLRVLENGNQLSFAFSVAGPRFIPCTCGPKAQATQALML